MPLLTWGALVVATLSLVVAALATRRARRIQRQAVASVDLVVHTVAVIGVDDRAIVDSLLSATRRLTADARRVC